MMPNTPGSTARILRVEGRGKIDERLAGKKVKSTEGPAQGSNETVLEGKSGAIQSKESLLI
jgi:hypothetical protein